jgi:hypothetical protein
MDGFVAYHRYSKEEDCIRLGVFAATVALCVYQHERLSEPAFDPYFAFDPLFSTFWDSDAATEARVQEVRRQKYKGKDWSYSPIMVIDPRMKTSTMREAIKRNRNDPPIWSFKHPRMREVIDASCGPSRLPF